MDAMLENELRHRVQVEDSEESARCTIRLRDAFLNYTFSDQLKVALKDVCRERAGRGVRSFVIDLTAVNVMDSCGLSLLIGLRKLVEAAEGRFVLVASSPILLRLFAITRLDSVFEIVRDEAAATAALLRPPATSSSAA